MSGDDDGHLLSAHLFQSLEEFGLASDIEMRRWLVQEQNTWLPDQDARQSDGLLLSARQAATTFGNGHIVSHWMAGDKSFHPRQPRCGENFFIGRLGLAQRNIVAQFSKEQVGILHRKADAGAEIRRVILSRIDAVDENSSFLGFIETEQKTADRGFSRSDTSDNADPFSTIDLEGDFIQCFAGGVWIGEADVLEIDASFADFSL